VAAPMPSWSTSSSVVVTIRSSDRPRPGRLRRLCSPVARLTGTPSWDNCRDDNGQPPSSGDARIIMISLGFRCKTGRTLSRVGGGDSGIPASRRLPEPGRYRHTRPDRVAYPEQRTEIHSVLRPQRRNYQMIPAGMRTSPALALNLPTGSDPHPAHHARRACGAIRSRVESLA
jgi:hypothetical protein